MKKKNLFKILVVFVLSVFILSSFAITSSAASSQLRPNVLYRFVDTPYFENSFYLDVDFVVDGFEYYRLEFEVEEYEGNYFVSNIYGYRYSTGGSSLYDYFYSDGAWISESYRFVEFVDLNDVNILSGDFVSLRNILIEVSDTPYGGLYGNVYSLIQDKIYGGYPLSGGAEIACSTVSTFLTIFVLVLPLALVWLIIKGLTALIGRVY